MEKNFVKTSIKNVATKNLSGKYNLTVYREGGKRHDEKLKAETHKAVCEQIAAFAEANPDIPMYIRLGAGVAQGACRQSKVAEGYKSFDAEKVVEVYDMAKAYNAHHGIGNRKPSDVTIRLMLKFYAEVGGLKELEARLGECPILGKACGTRGHYQELCAYLGISKRGNEETAEDVTETAETPAEVAEEKVLAA